MVENIRQVGLHGVYMLFAGFSLSRNVDVPEVALLRIPHLVFLGGHHRSVDAALEVLAPRLLHDLLAYAVEGVGVLAVWRRWAEIAWVYAFLLLYLLENFFAEAGEGDYFSRFSPPYDLTKLPRHLHIAFV